MNLIEVTQILLENKLQFPNLYKLFKIALTIPISSTTRERSSKLKPWLRTLMIQDRFSNICRL